MDDTTGLSISTIFLFIVLLAYVIRILIVGRSKIDRSQIQLERKQFWKNFFKTPQHMKQQHAEGILRPNGIVINSLHILSNGPLVSGAPWFQLPVSATPEKLGEAVVAALRASQRPSWFSRFKKIDINDAALRAERYKAHGVRSESEYVHDAKHVNISCDNEMITFLPSRKDGMSFSHLLGQDLKITKTADATEIAQTLKAAWGRCL